MTANGDSKESSPKTADEPTADANELASQLHRIAREGLPVFTGQGLVDGLRRAADAIIRGLAQAMVEAAHTAERAFEFGIPPNWEELTFSQMEDVAKLMQRTGWSLAWTPPGAVIEKVLAEKDAEAAGQLLLAAEGQIIDDLDRLLRDSQLEATGAVRKAARDALEAYRSGYLAPAQALTTVALTHAIHSHLEELKLSEARGALSEFKSEEADIWIFRFSAVASALATTLEASYPGDPPPQKYNRHASTHGLSASQYGQLNSLTSLMLLISLIVEIEATAELLTD